MKSWQQFLESVIPDAEERETFCRNFRKVVSSEEFSFFERHGLPARRFVMPITLGDRISGNTSVNHIRER